MRFEINFQKQSSLETFFDIFRRIAFRRELIFSLAFLLSLGFYSLYYFSSGKSTIPPAKDVHLSQKMKEIDLKRNKVAGLIKVLQQLKKERVIWSEKLWALDKNVSGGLWLTEMETKNIKKSNKIRHRQDKVEGLVLRGLTDRRQTGAIDPVKRFIRSLGKDSNFMNDYYPPFLVSIDKSMIGDEELDRVEICLIRKKADESK